MRLKGFVSESAEYKQKGRSEDIDMSSAARMIKKNCMKSWNLFMRNRDGLFRGNVSSKNGFAFVDPKKGQARKSANTGNHYTLIIDNSPLWKTYPKRSKSLICSTNRQAAYSGNQFLVLPYDNQKIGIVPASDMWSGFYDTWGDDINTINQHIRVFYSQVFDKRPNTDKNWATLSKVIKELDDWMLETKVPRNKVSRYDFLDKMSRTTFGYNPNGTLSEFLGWVFDPKNNGFYVVKAGDELPRLREAWTDSKCVLINYREIGRGFSWDDDKVEKMDELIESQ